MNELSVLFQARSADIKDRLGSALLSSLVI